jgi:hypothetical protein
MAAMVISLEELPLVVMAEQIQVAEAEALDKVHPLVLLVLAGLAVQA